MKTPNISINHGVVRGDPTKKAANVSFIYISTVKSKYYKVIDTSKFRLKHNEPII